MNKTNLNKKTESQNYLFTALYYFGGLISILIILLALALLITRN